MFYIMIRIWVIQVYAYLRFVHFILRIGKIKLKKNRTNAMYAEVFRGNYSNVFNLLSNVSKKR